MAKQRKASLRDLALQQSKTQKPKRDFILERLKSIDPEFATEFEDVVREYCTGGEIAGAYRTKQAFVEFLVSQPQLAGERSDASIRCYITRKQREYGQLETASN